MIATNVRKAQALGKIVPDLCLIAREPLPDFRSITDSDAAMSEDAVKVVDALIDSLPQGTIDRLTAELLRRRASSLVVRLADRS